MKSISETKSIEIYCAADTHNYSNYYLNKLTDSMQSISVLILVARTWCTIIWQRGGRNNTTWLEQYWREKTDASHGLFNINSYTKYIVI